jgi:ABC-2 type transport system permease protein/oleandomycin transport system permease protein
MTALTNPDAATDLADERPRPVSDALTIAWRNLLNIRRNPQLLVFATIQPVMFVLMFRYVFGGAIHATWDGRPVPYVDFLMPGIFVQTVTFGALTTGVGLAEDLQKGLIDRFRSLPMARSAVLVGRTLADLLRNVFVVLLMAIVGFLVGWRINTDVAGLVACLLLVVAFAYALSWLFAIVGMAVRDGETAQAASFPILAPLVFASSAFVPVDTMPGWLQAFAEHQPVSAVCNAGRALTLGGPTAEYVLTALAWIVAIVAVCAPLAVRRYRRAT